MMFIDNPRKLRQEEAGVNNAESLLAYTLSPEFAVDRVKIFGDVFTPHASPETGHSASATVR
jgi:hypothetical protein